MHKNLFLQQVQNPIATTFDLWRVSSGTKAVVVPSGVDPNGILLPADAHLAGKLVPSKTAISHGANLIALPSWAKIDAAITDHGYCLVSGEVRKAVVGA